MKDLEFQNPQSFIETSELIKLSSGDLGFIREMIEVFIYETELNFNHIRIAIPISDFEIIRFNIHKVKSGFKITGIKDHGLIASVENKAKEGLDIHSITNDFLLLTKIFDFIKSHLKDIFQV